MEIMNTNWGFWVLFDGFEIAGIVRSNYEPDGANFVTPDSFGLQVAIMNRPAGYIIPSHFHLPVPRALVGTQEVLFIQRGSLRADLFSPECVYLCSVNLKEGDVIILNSGGHGFEASQDCLFFEVKQGPYVEGKDKEIFAGIVDVSTKIRLVG